MTTNLIARGNDHYPKNILNRLGSDSPSCLYALGNLSILDNRLIGLVCSVQCPGSIVIKTFDAVRELRDQEIVMAGGFHSPMEKECLDILLNGKHPVVLCPARSLKNLRIGQKSRQALKEGRLLIISPFAETIRRTTSQQAIQRNDLVAALSDVLLVPYASPGGKTWTTVNKALSWGQPIFTFLDNHNAELFDAGARIFQSIPNHQSCYKETILTFL